MMSKAKAKIMEKMMDSMMGEFNPETMIDMMFEKPILVYAEIAFFKTDTGKLCCTVNKLPHPQRLGDLKIKTNGLGEPITNKEVNQMVIVLPTADKEAIRGDP